MTVNITISMPDELHAYLVEEVEAEEAASVSAFIQQVLRERQALRDFTETIMDAIEADEWIPLDEVMRQLAEEDAAEAA